MEEVDLGNHTYVGIEDETISLSQDGNHIHLDPPELERLFDWLQGLNWIKACYPPIKICAMCKQPLLKLEGKQP